jgi:hypothetical protein
MFTMFFYVSLIVSVFWEAEWPRCEETNLLDPPFRQAVNVLSKLGIIHVPKRRRLTSPGHYPKSRVIFTELEGTLQHYMRHNLLAYLKI